MAARPTSGCQTSASPEEAAIAEPVCAGFCSIAFSSGTDSGMAAGAGAVTMLVVSAGAYSKRS
jgi:hypothetical protein